MAVIMRENYASFETEYEHIRCKDSDPFCPRYIKYKSIKYDCPCWEFGKSKSIKMMKNLVKQWKAWARIKEE